jgi:hypothetical protein
VRLHWLKIRENSGSVVSELVVGSSELNSCLCTFYILDTDKSRFKKAIFPSLVRGLFVYKTEVSFRMSLTMEVMVLLRTQTATKLPTLLTQMPKVLSYAT